MLMAIDERSLTCKDFVELVTDYLEVQLSPSDKERFEAHLASCDGCTVYLHQMQKMIRTLGSLPEDSLSPHAQEKLLRLFRDLKRPG
jgi:anti-sigma factor RsiW